MEQAVCKYGNDTVALLHDVYRTPPIWEAAPGGELVLSRPQENPLPEAPLPEGAALPALSKTKVNRLKALITERRQQSQSGKGSSYRSLHPDTMKCSPPGKSGSII